MKYARFALVGLLFGLAMAGACAESEPPSQCPGASASAVADPELRVFLSRLKSAHELADKAIERDDRRAAIMALEEAVAQSPDTAGPAREATADALARVAELRASEGELDAALSAVEQGLEDAPAGSYLEGRLYEVRGGIELARAEDAPEDTGARIRAAEAFERAAAVQREVVASARACAPTNRVVDVGLVAFLSLAEATHRLADIAEAENELGTAEALLTELASDPLAVADGAPPEAREVLGDTYARLAELKSARGQFDAARRDVSRGLELAVERTHYRGRLMEVLGLVEERLHDSLLADGRTDQAEAAKKRAIEAFSEAVEIQDEVIRSTLENER
jgi:tetratricopeptide (TPR) repeat protein